MILRPRVFIHQALASQWVKGTLAIRPLTFRPRTMRPWMMCPRTIRPLDDASPRTMRLLGDGQSVPDFFSPNGRRLFSFKNLFFYLRKTLLYEVYSIILAVDFNIFDAGGRGVRARAAGAARPDPPESNSRSHRDRAAACGTSTMFNLAELRSWSRTAICPIC
jgi:hypothetical protein